MELKCLYFMFNKVLFLNGQLFFQTILLSVLHIINELQSLYNCWKDRPHINKILYQSIYTLKIIIMLLISEYKHKGLKT